MLSMQPQSAVTSWLAPVAFSAATLSLTIAVDTSGCLSEKVPPKPQHSDSWSWWARVTLPRRASSSRPTRWVPISRRAEHEVCSVTVVAGPSSLRLKPTTCSRNSASSKVRAAIAAARALRAGSAPTTFSQCQRIIPPQEPDGTTMGWSPGNRSSCDATTRRASSGKPLVKAGWPQQVWLSGKITRMPSRSRRVMASMPASGTNMSTRQVA